MSAAARSPKTRLFTAETARATLLARLAKVGAKGATSLYPPSTAAEKRVLFEEASALLEREQALFVDRRKVKPRFFAWEHRPAIPTAESVAEMLAVMVSAAMPVVSTRARLKAALKKHKPEAPLFETALAQLIASGGVQVLQYPKGKKKEELYIPATPATPGASVPVGFDPERARGAYHALVAGSGFPTVAISALQRESGAPLEALQAWLRAEHQAGRAVLALGDWSLADSEKRRAAIEWLGQPHLLVRLILS